MNLQAIRYFLMVSTTGSFQATARHFQVPASSVSRFVAALEKELGQQLLYRNTRAVRLTEAGEQFFLQVRDAVELLDQAAEGLVHRDADINGLVRINAPETLGRLHIAGIVNALQARYPELIVELTLTDAYIDPVQEGADITIRVSPLLDSGLIGKVIGAQRHVVAASPAYIAAHGRPATPGDLLTHRCLVYKGQLGAQKWYYRMQDADPFQTLNVSGPLRSNNAEALLAAAVAGRGIVVFPTWVYRADMFKTGELVALLDQWEFAASPDPTYIQMLSPENRLRSRKVREVSAFIVEAIGAPPYWDGIGDGIGGGQ
ncbi:LysR family transcriptional regulator [Cupriavidus plantarum]|uniref:LysR family transcriptional regulator n=1 Tax=Cupriavidus plantarum TaxID=942865 RepID=UPI000E264806|nr:LysR family transcriptional regulator [Cupriavidus plantarum]REE92665.1 LysR family transcriptional regulator [Cupriavidus plantarum]